MHNIDIGLVHKFLEAAGWMVSRTPETGYQLQVTLGNEPDSKVCHLSKFGLLVYGMQGYTEHMLLDEARKIKEEIPVAVLAINVLENRNHFTDEGISILSLTDLVDDALKISAYRIQLDETITKHFNNEIVPIKDYIPLNFKRVYYSETWEKDKEIKDILKKYEML